MMGFFHMGLSSRVLILVTVVPEEFKTKIFLEVGSIPKLLLTRNYICMKIEIMALTYSRHVITEVFQG